MAFAGLGMELEYLSVPEAPTLTYMNEKLGVFMQPLQFQGVIK